MRTVGLKLSDIKPFTDEQLAHCSRQELFTIIRTQQKAIEFAQTNTKELEEKIILVEGNYIRILTNRFSPSSEKSRKNKPKSRKAPKSRAPTSKLPSERYPNAEIIDENIAFVEAPECKCCGFKMQDSGLLETTEHLTVIPKKYIIVRQHRHKYRCGKCHGSIVTAPTAPRVVPGSSYSDELVVDATLSKYCDLIPMERYCQMAARQGFPGIPPQSLIGVTFKLADFLKPVYDRLKQETLNTPILLADETPHRMLEGDKKKNWFLWGFLSEGACFYECHDTRSGDVASAVLQQSNCEVLLTDVYAGYKKAVREANKIRADQGLLPIEIAYCNSHARRGFITKNDEEAPKEATFMVEQYKAIYTLEASAKTMAPEQVLEIRGQMQPIFDNMKQHAEAVIESFSSKSTVSQAFNYFLKNFASLTLFLKNPLVPIDNNPSERILRSPVVGRKTWYGTHSKDGAQAAAIHFSLIESCKLNSINPRTYYAELINRIHMKQSVLTPKEYMVFATANSS